MTIEKISIGGDIMEEYLDLDYLFEGLGFVKQTIGTEILYFWERKLDSNGLDPKPKIMVTCCGHNNPSGPIITLSISYKELLLPNVKSNEIKFGLEMLNHFNNIGIFEPYTMRWVFDENDIIYQPYLIVNYEPKEANTKDSQELFKRFFVNVIRYASACYYKLIEKEFWISITSLSDLCKEKGDDQ